MQILNGHKAGSTVRSLAFSHDGTKMASSARDGKTLLWDLATGTPQIIFRGGFRPLAFSPDGNTLAAVGKGAVGFWDCRRGEARSIKADISCLRATFSPDGRLLITTGNTLRIWDGSTCAPFPTGSPAGAGCPDISHEDPPRDRRTIGTLHDYERTTNGLAFTRDGAILASGHESYIQPRFVALWDTVTWKLREKFTGHRFSPDGLAFTPDGRFLVAASGPTLCVWDVARRELVVQQKVSQQHLKDIALTPDGRLLGCALNDGSIHFWHTSDWSEAASYDWKVGALVCLAFAPDGMRCAAGSASGDIVVFDVDL
jgi:WD40 repeat protein